MSVIISNNNRLLLLPSLKTEARQDLDNVSVNQLLRADLSRFQFKFNNEPLPKNYTHNEPIQLPRLSISEDNSQKWSVPHGDHSSRSSVFSNESDDDGFSSNEEDFHDDSKDEEEPKLVPILPSPQSIDPETEESREPSIESIEVQPRQSIESVEVQPKPTVKRPSIASVEDLTMSEATRSKRQRVGPSCDLCRSKKIKCDAHVEIVEMNITSEGLELVKNNEISAPDAIAKHITPEEQKLGFKLMYSNEKMIKFKGCTYCEVRNHPCVYERGYTKDDILRYNMARNIKKKKKTSRKKRS